MLSHCGFGRCPLSPEPNHKGFPRTSDQDLRPASHLLSSHGASVFAHEDHAKGLREQGELPRNCGSISQLGPGGSALKNNLRRPRAQTWATSLLRMRTKVVSTSTLNPHPTISTVSACTEFSLYYMYGLFTVPLNTTLSTARSTHSSQSLAVYTHHADMP